MIEEKDTYTKEEVKHILANLIERIGHDSAAVCCWNGVNYITVDEWNNALFTSMSEFHTYGQNLAFHKVLEFARVNIK